MKNVTAKQIMTYVLLLGLLLFMAVYFFVFKKYQEKTEELENSNAALQVRVNQLKEYYDKLDDYNTEMAQMQEKIGAWLDEFPADVKEEDIIVLAINTEKNAIVGYKNINIGDREALSSVTADVVSAAGIEGLGQEITFIQRKTSYVNLTDYANLKRCIATINENANRSVISNISYSTNEDEGCLEGTIEVTFYSVSGTGKEYVPQKLPAYESGLSDLFGVLGIAQTE